MTTQPRSGFVRVPHRKQPPPPPPPDPPKVEAVDEPTDEQLANVASVLGFPILATPMFMGMPHWREAMLNLHGLLVRTLNGDAKAEATLQRLIDAFATTGELRSG